MLFRYAIAAILRHADIFALPLAALLLSLIIFMPLRFRRHDFHFRRFHYFRRYAAITLISLFAMLHAMLR